MIRVIRGHTARRRRKKIRLFASTFRGAHSKLTRTTIQQKTRALVSSCRDRVTQKRDFRRLWITRINAVTRFRNSNIFHSYSKLIHKLYKKQLFLNRKILSQIAISNKNYLDMIFKKIKSSTSNKRD
uniref:Large ribosomal subunit protein bL20c n=1 Tax=Campylosiphon championii TaxID=1861789 RepID=A0A2H4EC22_9LILI|nr:ribosomal protein L20 [Burmannia championii]ANK36282.1 ribosomal protein L20 [Burmannia championii]